MAERLTLTGLAASVQAELVDLRGQLGVLVGLVGERDQAVQALTERLAAVTERLTALEAARPIPGYPLKTGVTGGSPAGSPTGGRVAAGTAVPIIGRAGQTYSCPTHRKVVLNKGGQCPGCFNDRVFELNVGLPRPGTQKGAPGVSAPRC